MNLSELKFPKSLGSDNHSGVHPEILKAVLAANRGHAHSYGMDEVSELALIEFKRIFGSTVHPFYVFNGTAANVISLSVALKRYQAVMCSEQAHLHLDECAAPEAVAGNKVIPIPSKDGKILPEQIMEWMGRFGDQHFAQPRLVSLTQPTELGVVYTLKELKAWRDFANKHNLSLHLDGTRLSNAAFTLDCNLQEMTSLFDFVSFGGTKNGLLGAEVILSFNPESKEDLRFHRKQMLNLPSKTRFLAAQYLAYLKNDLFKTISSHVCTQAKLLEERLLEFPEIQIVHPVQSNALFVKLPKEWIKPLKEEFFFYIWDSNDNVARWMISFDWDSEDSNQLINKIREVKKRW